MALQLNHFSSCLHFSKNNKITNKYMNAILLTVGDEILIGQVVDTNSAWMGNQLNAIGVHVSEILSVSDDLAAIKEAIGYALNKADVVLMTGGLGPTKDDITKLAIAQYFNVGTVYSQETYDKIAKIFERFGKTMSESHKIQCYMPENAILVDNKMGTAPGMMFEQGTKLLFSMPGVPHEMKSIMKESVLGIIATKLPSNVHIYHKTIMTSGEGESFIADRIEPLIEQMPDYIKLAYLPSLGHVRLRLTGKHQDKETLYKELDHYTKVIVDELGSIVYEYDNVSLEEHLKNLLNEKGLTLSTAESCTGGNIAHMITSIPGSSSYFLGSIVSYSNEIKSALLNVNTDTLSQHGAVSEECVKEMLVGLLNQTRSDLGISVSGVAGPDGGSKEKPVGTVWIAVGNKENVTTTLIKVNRGERSKNIEYASHVALNKLRLFVQNHY
jgi:nicotinamide-nucleotide amidase